MVDVILIDADMQSLTDLAEILSQVSEVKISGTFTNPLEALSFIKITPPHVVFLEIELPYLDGFAVFEEIYSIYAEMDIVFTTQFSRYAVKAFELGVTDYLLKPYSLQRLRTTFKRIMKGREKPKNPRSPSSYLLNNSHSYKIPVWDGDYITLVNQNDILYCEVSGKQTRIRTHQNTYITNKPLKYYIEQLASGNFFQCHKSFLVNYEHVDKIVPWFGNTYMIKLKGDDAEIPVSRHYAKMLKELFAL